MNKLILSFSITLMSCTILLAGNISLIKETRNLSDFDQIAVSGNIEVLLVKSNKTEATVDVSKGEIEDLTTEIKNGTLKIKFEDNLFNWGKNNRKGYVTVYYKSLEGISSSAGSSIESNESIEAKDFELKASSGSDADLEINAEEIEIRVSSGANIDLSGSTDYQSVKVSSGGGFEGYDFKSKKTIVKASSGGDAKVFASEEIRASASSGGGVKYKGDPIKTDIDSSISGNISKR